MWLLVFTILILPYEQNPRMWLADSFLGIIPEFTVIKLLGLLGFAWAVVRILGGHVPEGPFASRQAKIFAVFFAGVILSGLLNASGVLAAIRYLGLLLFLPFMLASVRTHDDLRRVVYAMALAFVIAFPYALYQKLKWGTRLGINVYESNYLAANLALVIPLTLAIASHQPTPGRRRLWLLAAGVLIVMLFLTGSRGGFLGLLVAGSIFVYRRRGAGAAFGLALALLVAVLPTTVGQRAIASLTLDLKEAAAGGGELHGLDRSNEAHVALFWAALRMIADEPLTGVGPYNFKALSRLYSGFEKDFIAHNTYFEIAAEMGLPVLAVFLVLLGAVFRGFRPALGLTGNPRAREVAAWAEGLRSGFIGFLVAGTFISAQYEKWFWLAVFLSIAIQRIAVREHQEALASESTEGTPASAPV